MANYGIYPAIFGALTVNNLDRVEPNSGIQVVERIAGGSVDRQLVCVTGADPSIGLTSRDLQTILASCTTSAGLAATGEIQYQARSAGGTFSGSSVHGTLNMGGTGFLMVDDFGAELGGEGGDINLTYHPVSSDGITNPVVFNASQALSGSPAVNALHFAGPVAFEGAALVNTQSIRFRTGMTVRKNIPSGGVYPNAVYIVERKPILEIVARDLQAVAAVGLGVSAISSGITAYLRKGTASGIRVADGSSVHIAIAVTAGMYRLDSISAQGQEDASVRLMVMPTAYSIALTSTIA